MKRSWILVTMLLIASCIRGTPPANTGVVARVSIGPMCPVVRVDQPCPDRPFQADVIVTDSTGSVVARGETDAAGSIRLALLPGEYQLEARSPDDKAYPRAATVDVRVTLGLWTQVAMSLDSGIR
jgi:hypothetical protein